MTLFALTPAGAGLTAQYYDNADFTSLKTTRTDAVVNFDWGTAIPSGTAITNGDAFSVAWSGQVEPEFSELYTFHVTADDGARLWIDEQLVAARTFAQGTSEMRAQVPLTAGRLVNVRLEYFEQTGSASVKLEWSSPSRAREVIPSARLYPARGEKVGGSLLKEHWSGLPGVTIPALTSFANYPSKPGGRELLTSFEGLAQNWADNYGTRVTGFIVPPVSGNYVFAVSGDEVCELRLSTDATPANATLIASVSAATAFRQWNAQPTQQSAPRALVQGQRYFVELLHKEGTGDDHFSVGWMMPGDAAFSVIPGSALVPPRLTDAQPAQAALLDTMAQERPRMFATAERFAALKATYLNPASSQPKTWAQNAINAADTILTQAPVAYTQDVRGTILGQARTVKDRMYRLGVAWWMTGNAQYAERAWTELNQVADNTAFPDWHPAHFLDTAEMTHACAIGYDWFYHYWTPSRRDTIRTAIISKGLNVGLSLYNANAWWAQSTANNWNMVCNGGMAMGALVVGTESEALTENIINRALNSTRPVWRHFTTDAGNWYEGPGYWGYTTEYGIRMFAALQWILGSDFGISATTGVSESGFAPIHSLGPSNIIFNYADAGAGGGPRGAPQQWMARRFGQPIYDWWVNQGSGGALEALWWNASAASLASTASSPDAAFHGESGTVYQPQEMVTMRGKWNDSRTTFVACKGGQMGADHGNLDAGTFVLDALGKRWFHDLGGDDYALPGYFNETPGAGNDRWDYYRMRPEGQNTLTINPSANPDMVLNAVAPLLAFQGERNGSSSFTIHDLTPVYSGMTRVWRGVRLFGARNQVLVQDEIQAATGKTVWWFAHYTHPATSVTIEPDGTAALLQQGSERLWCKIVSGGGTFQIMNAAPLPTSPNPSTTPSQNANTGYKKLAINLTNVTNTTLAVWFVPLATGQTPPPTLPTITSLNSWNIAEASDPPAANNGNGTLDGDNSVDIDLRGYVTDDTTPAAQMRFAVANGVNGTITLLPDGHTARFTPTPGYTGVPQFDFTVTDTTPDPRMVLAYDFDAPDSSIANIAPDVSSNARDGTIDFAASGTYSLVSDKPSALGGQGSRTIDLVEDGTNAARAQRVLSAGELNWNTGNFTVVGWFKRRDTANDDIVWHISDGDGFGSNDELYLNCPAGATTVRLQHFNAAGAALDVDIVQSGVSVGTWHHFAVVRNGTSLSLFINGALVGTDSSFALALQQAQPVVFGGHASTTFQPARWFDGGLDDLGVFNAALPVEEVAALANGLTMRHFGGLSATGTITLSVAPVTYNWTAPSSGNWSAAGNWQGSTTPASSRGAAVQFFNGQTLTGSSVISTQDVGANFQLNILTLAGSASAASSAAIGSGSLAFVNNGVLNPTVNLNATNGSSANTLSYEVSAPLNLGAPVTFTGNGSATFRVSGGISGPGDLIKSGSSTLTLSGANTFSGDVTISAGTLRVGNDGATGSLGSGSVTNDATLRFDRTGVLLVPNNLSGTGSLIIDCPIDPGTKAALGTIELSGANDFTGNVTISSGALRITNSNALGAGAKAINITNGTNGNPQLHLDGSGDPIVLPPEFLFQTSNNASGAIINDAGTNTIEGDIALSGGGGDTRLVVAAGSLTFSGDVAPVTTNRNLRLLGSGAGAITGTIRNGSDTNALVSVVKGDAGSWLLAGQNSHSGVTNLDAGTLILGSATALGTGGVQLGNSSGGTFITTNGPTLDLNGQSGVDEVITLRGAGVGGNGALINSSATPASLAGGTIASISTTAGGTHSSVPTVVISGGGGTGATATATLAVTAASFTINGGTTVYSSAPSVTISGGGGLGATATAVLTSGVVSGITITNGGTGFTSAPSIAFSGGTVTTAGTNPTGTGNATNFTVAGLAVTNAGGGYSSAPSVTFSSGTGTTAVANRSSVVLAANTTIGGAGDIAIDAPISGGFALAKVGAGTLALNGAHSYTGATTINAGRLALSGTLASSITAASGGTFAPLGSPGTTGNVAINSGGTFETKIDGPAVGSQYSQLSTSGTVTFGGVLEVVAGPGLIFGTSFTLLNKTSAGAISGAFAGKPQGSVFAASGYHWQISYTGGNGNDLTLTLVSGLEAWRYTYFSTIVNSGNAADLVDPNRDGEVNLYEFATAQIPQANTLAIPALVRNGNALEFTYPRAVAAIADGVVFTVEWSDTLAAGSWSSVGVTEQILSDDGTVQTVRATLPAGSALRRFVILRVTRP